MTPSKRFCFLKDKNDLTTSQVQWVTPVISVTREKEIGRIVVQGQPVQKVSKITSFFLFIVLLFICAYKA
jgi:hypothetical protein